MFKLIFVILVTFYCSGVFSSDQLVKVDDPNGLEAFPGVFPWATYIEVLNDNTLNYRSECVGNIIAPTWVFAPARCLTSTINRTYRLHFGAVNFTHPEISMVSTTSFIHPDFALFNGHNGGLIKLPMALEFSGTIGAITLPFNIDDQQFENTKAYFVGRRRMLNTETQMTHVILRWNYLEIISDEQCDSSNFGRVKHEICALGTEFNRHKAPCNALGHLAVYWNSTYILIGGGGDDMCTSDDSFVPFWPNFFPRMSELLEWITEVTEINQ